MTTPPSAFPDVEAMVVDVLQADPGLTTTTATVAVTPPAGFDGTQRVVLVSRLGGAWISDRHLDEPLIQFEVYGPDKPTAHVIANAARHALLGAIGTRYGTTTFTDVTEQDGPHWLPDYLYSGASRYVCILKVSLAVA